MDVSFSKAAQAYANKPTPESVKVGGSDKPSSGDSFADMLSSAADSAVDSLQAGEKASMQAAAGTANMTDVVTAVTQAEVTLQTVMSIRDTLVNSLKQVMQMPL